MSDGPRRLEPDGRDTPNARSVELHERVARLESNQKSIKSTVERVEDKVDGIAEGVDESMTTQEFQHDYEKKIRKSHRTAVVIRWVGGAVVVVSSIAAAAGAIGVL